MTDDRTRNGERPPQLHIWDAGAREFELGTLVDGDDTWELYVLCERTSSELCRGRLSFRQGDERFDTGAILVEESEKELLRRAGELPASMLRQLLDSLRL
ncbi:MAG: hypothetical protein R6X22_00695 [Gemmatimonadota bacterium]